MSEKLLIAKYKDGFVQYSEYHKSIHEGKLYCPFCDPPIRVTYNIKGFFMAWKNEGGHNCGKAREQAKYLDADWKGRKITEILRNQGGELEITIDINTLVYSKRKNIDGTENNIDASFNEKNQDVFPIYKDRKEVFRDVVRSVYQMKRILENNEQEFLKKLKFKFRTSEGRVSLNDIVFKIHELNHNIVGKTRFVMFKVNNSVLNNGILYINSYSARGVNLTAKLNYPYNKNPFKRLHGEYVIAYGKITYSEKSGKYFVTLTNDFQIRKLKEDVGAEFFDEIEFEKYDYKAFVKPERTNESTNKNVNKVLENKKVDKIEEKINKTITNNNTNTGIKTNYVHKNSLVNDSIDKSKINNPNDDKIKQLEKIEQNVNYKRENSPVSEANVNSGGFISGVKTLLKNLISK